MKNFHLAVSAIIVVTVALIYGVNPSHVTKVEAVVTHSARKRPVIQQVIQHFIVLTHVSPLTM